MKCFASLVCLLLCAVLAQAQDDFLYDSAGKPLVNLALYDSSGKSLVATRHALPKGPTCDCGCNDGGTCDCDFCPKDKAAYQAARKTAAAGQLPLVLYVGHEDLQREKEVGTAAVQLRVDTFPGAVKGDIVIGTWNQDGGLDRTDLRNGRRLSGAGVRDAISKAAGASRPTGKPKGGAAGIERRNAGLRNDDDDVPVRTNVIHFRRSNAGRSC